MRGLASVGARRVVRLASSACARGWLAQAARRRGCCRRLSTANVGKAVDSAGDNYAWARADALADALLEDSSTRPGGLSTDAVDKGVDIPWTAALQPVRTRRLSPWRFPEHLCEMTNNQLLRLWTVATIKGRCWCGRQAVTCAQMRSVIP
mgnify:CR=1 FL=1